jgi:hypothetical protein
MAQELQVTPDHLQEDLFNHQVVYNQCWKAVPSQTITIDQNLLI